MQREKSSVKIENPFVSTNAASDASSDAKADRKTSQSSAVAAPPIIVTRQRAACKCNCEHAYRYIAYTIRILAALTCLAMGVSGGWAVYQASKLYATEQHIPPSCPVSAFVDPKQFATFLGLIGVYFCVFAILGVLAEIRHDFLRSTVLRPFGFLQSWLGRGVFYLILGCLLIQLPIDSELRNASQRYITAIIPAVFLLACGVAEILVGLCVRKERVVVRGATVSRTGSSKAAAHRNQSPGKVIKWGAPEGTTVDNTAEQETATTTTSTHAETQQVTTNTAIEMAPAPTPSRKPLLELPDPPKRAGNPFLQK